MNGGLYVLLRTPVALFRFFRFTGNWPGWRAESRKPQPGTADDKRTLKKIEAKQEKLVQLYYQDLVTMDVFEREQAKLKTETKAAERLRKVAVAQTEDIDQALEEAFARVERTQQSYLEATPLERRGMNRVFFERIEIGEDGEITAAILTPTYKAIAAWQPNLGQPKANGPAAQGHQKPPLGACSAFLRRRRFVAGWMQGGAGGP